MARTFEVLVGSLNFRDKPGGTILMTLPRASWLEEIGSPTEDASGATWLSVKVLPAGTPSGYVCEKFVGHVEALGQEGPQATAAPDVTEDRLRLLAPNARAWIVTALTSRFVEVAAPYGVLDNPRRLCHFLAQAAHESDGFRTLEEYGGESYWRRYEGRADLGNTTAGDGVRYHGRGIFQLTGRSNYHSMGAKIGLALEDDPVLAAEGDVSLHTACEYWKARRIEGPADSNDINEVTRRINGGQLGLAERKAFFRRAWSIWGDPRQPSGI